MRMTTLVLANIDHHLLPRSLMGTAQCRNALSKSTEIIGRPIESFNPAVLLFSGDCVPIPTGDTCGYKSPSCATLVICPREANMANFQPLQAFSQASLPRCAVVRKEMINVTGGWSMSTYYVASEHLAELTRPVMFYNTDRHPFSPRQKSFCDCRIKPWKRVGAFASVMVMPTVRGHHSWGPCVSENGCTCPLSTYSTTQPWITSHG
ncbi:hypothetical protein BV22DRAFT_410424 [Leucogyrophana mollusca]|uniref:Uncharacterized protein n=1 Tax=Leucogyrophana mollusca TaxID=85980 RepID=A0ACB8BIN3_9AGAM|nr:hypothetical protein BV22DRAFT_410424 [Leucogyrophana mollusca]